MEFNTSTQKAIELASKVRLLALDVDGILTDGRLYFSNRGEELKTFHTLDGHGIKMLQERKIEIALITGRTSTILEQRAAELEIVNVFQGCCNKLSSLNTILENQSYTIDEVAYAGDDLPDLDAIRAVGLSFSVPNAHPTVKAAVDAITSLNGGWGAVREISDFILESQGKSPLLNKSTS